MSTDKTFRITVIVVALIAFMVGIWWVQGRQERGDQAARDKQRYAAIIKANDAFAANRKYDQAEKQLKEYLAANPPEQYKRGATVLLATTYSNHEKYDEAIEWYQKAERMDGEPKADVVVGLAYTYDAKGDKAKAIEYFKKAIVLAEKSNDPMADADKRSYEVEIRRLEGVES